MKVPRYVVLDKPIGQTPLEAIDAWRATHPELSELPATYAGRLDPMASGKLLVLLGEECKRRKEYLGMDKEYEVEVVLGVRTDTGDALGMADSADAEIEPVRPSAVKSALRMLSGTHRVPYPSFSSKTVNGKPLFQYALEGTLNSIHIPEHEETIYSCSLLGIQVLSAKQLQERIRAILSHVPTSDDPRKTLGADFRQDAIRARWNELFSADATREFTVVMLRVTGASGTYMRTLAERLGRALGTSAFALSIHRTTIGRYVPLSPFVFWRRRY